MSKVRFVDNVGVNAFGNVSPEAIITASGGVGNIIFTKENGNQIILPLATTQSSADSLTTASVSNNIITFTKGDSSTFSVTVATGSGGGGSVNTGSLLTTGSVSNNILTFTKGDGTSFTLVVNTGSGEPLPAGTVSSSAQITELGFITSSATASFITNSQTSSMSVLSAQTASYVLNAVSSSHAVFAISASYAVSASHEIIKEISSSHANFADTASKSLDNVLTASVNLNTITFTKGDNSTFALTIDTGSGGGGSVPAGTVSSSAQVTELGFINQTQTSSMTVGTASIANFIPFNGNRAVSNQDQPAGIKNVNFNANGLVDFINKVYFTNTAPVITTSNFTIGEFVVSGSTVGTVNATDAESGSQTVTFSTSSTYVADQFRIHSGSGVITLNVKSTSSMNTFGSGSPAVDVAPFPVVATDTFGLTGSKTIFIRVTPNTAPIWSTVQDGSLTTSATSSLSESSALGNDKDRYYFRDDESDTITIGSGSFSTHFTTAFRLVKTSNYVRLDQITASLDYDLYPTYSFVLTASDEHYESGDDPSSIAYLPVRINILDDLPPTIDPQTLGGINENSSTGAVAGTVSATNNDGGTITFTGFVLKSANKDGGTNITSSLGGTSLSNPSSDPFTINSGTGQVTRKAGQFFNSDIANRYIYTVTVTDNLNPSSNSADITIPIANDAASTITDNWTNLYIIESARTGEFVKNNANGFGGSTAQWSSVASQRWDITSTPDFIGGSNLTGSNTNLVLKSNLSGSATVGGNTIVLALTASENAFFTTKQLIDQNVSVVTMSAPDFTTSDQSSNLNTNGAKPGNALVTASITDPQSYGLNHSTFTFTPNAGQNLVAVRDGSSNRYFISASANLTAGTYGYTASIFNDRGFRTGSIKDEFAIAQAPIGSLTTNGTFRIIESAVSGALIRINADGRTGTQGDLGVNYSPRYNLASVQSFTSSNAAIAITDTGLLSMAVNVSGSPSSSGNTFTSDITFRDQFNNIGSGSITVNVTLNQAPTATMNLGAVSLLTSSLAVSGSVIASLTGSDPQSFENITSASLSGISASRFNLIDVTGASTTRRYEIQPLANLAAGSYPITGSVFDAFGKTGSANLDISISQFPNIPEVFVYISSRGAGTDLSDVSLLNSALGTAGQVDRPFGLWKAGNLGKSGNITTTGTNNMRMVVSESAGVSGNSLNGIVSNNVFNAVANGKTGNAIFILYPSGSDPRLGGVPSSIAESYDPGSPVAGQYVVEYENPSSADDKGITGAVISSSIPSYVLDLDGAGFTASNGTIINNGDAGYYRYWSVLTPTSNPWSQSTIKFYVTPQSGSSPTA